MTGLIITVYVTLTLLDCRGLNNVYGPLQSVAWRLVWDQSLVPSVHTSAVPLSTPVG